MKSIPPTFSRLSWRSFCCRGLSGFPKKGKTWPPKWIGWSIILWFISFLKGTIQNGDNFRVFFFVPSSWPHSQWFSHEVAHLSGRMKPSTLSLMTPTYRTSNFILVEIVGFWYIWFRWMWNHVVTIRYRNICLKKLLKNTSLKVTIQKKRYHWPQVSSPYKLGWLNMCAKKRSRDLASFPELFGESWQKSSGGANPPYCFLDFSIWTPIYHIDTVWSIYNYTYIYFIFFRTCLVLNDVNRLFNTNMI